MRPSHTHEGITLLEILLVLAVASAIIATGLRVYHQWNQYAEVLGLDAKVEQLLTAMRNYYQANCRQQWSPDGTAASPGTLDPARIANGTSLSITINNASSASDNTDLFNTGFLSSASWHPFNPLIDNDASDGGYTLQFIRQQANNADPNTFVYACPGDSTGPTTCTAAANTALVSSASTPTLQSSIIFWTAHVAVKLPDTTDADTANGLRAQAQADCLAANATDTCAASSGSGLYLIWERPAAMLTENTSSPLWMSLPQLKQFNMQYTNDGMSALSGVSSSTSSNYNIQNYLCGG